ncbi:hypothetical protein P7B02_07560 [Caulobacter segnis]|uniref:hypothetical protein n=1 Tax=Caulobacter segnis TaxID=88688 RepID=UPI00240F22B8|nr:hypothetical protein [Caulobacter segnis]MDG2521395.1 hypothetical protein [Caulobacter segnis]
MRPMLPIAAAVFALAATWAVAAPRLDCPTLEGAPALKARAPDYVLFGEAHGTKELPALFGDLVCAYAASGAVTVGLEFLPAEQAALDAYLASDGGAQARATLLASAGWSDRGGRASVAILDLIDRLREFKAAGADLTVVAFDHAGDNPASTSDARESGMARHLMAAKAARPAAPLLALTGIGHAGKSAWTSFNPPFPAMSQHLPADRTVATTFVRGGGEVWACRSPSQGAPQECRVWPSTAREAIPARGIRPDASREGFDAVVSPGAPYSGSPPARDAK